MSTLTKLVKLSWDSTKPDAMFDVSNEIIADLVAQGKTDGVWSRNSDAEFGGQMAFVDQAAAEEYVAAITVAGANCGRTLLSGTIIDI